MIRKEHKVLVLNFTHPLKDEHKARIETLTRQVIEEIRTIPVHLNQEFPLVPQIRTITDSIGLTPREWQTRPLLINPPGYALAACLLLAEIHGRIGHFPTLLRIRPAPGATLPQYEVAELLNLQHIREQARTRR
jgi:hypothetical protein